ncbi:carotenoid biosynthesis protein [Alkalicoccus daliensis]|uniref:Putative membrane protein n=1 Tax=Alkalicoccus daliensis TaxID=745820 RepID=A0A1H0B0J8_9BACI|nr:carotenoid biosynthesis protein [Alkalicoccus daliensis]SDN39170.1 putative membrane protein [Alkalicoccus daliensis]
MPAKFDLYIYRFFLVWYAIGVVLLTFDLVPPWLEWANVVFLVTSGFLGMIYFYRSQSRILGIMVVIFIFVLSIAIESFGVHTGLFFGEYSYQADFGPKVIGVPVTIGFAWVMVIATSHVLAAPLVNIVHHFSRIIYSVYGAFIAVSLDLILDPVAFEVKQYWVWHEGGFYYDIPFSNFLGWFILSFVLHFIISLVFFRRGEWRNLQHSFWKEKMLYLYGMMVVMFVIIAAVNGLILAPVIVIFLTAVFYVIYNKLQRKYR